MASCFADIGLVCASRRKSVGGRPCPPMFSAAKAGPRRPETRGRLNAHNKVSPIASTPFGTRLIHIRRPPKRRLQTRHRRARRVSDRGAISGLVLEDDILGNASLASTGGFSVQIPAIELEKRLASSAWSLATTMRRDLTIVLLAELSAILSRHADRNERPLRTPCHR